MEPLPFPAYLDHIRTESARFREVLAGLRPGGPGARLPGLGRGRPALAPRHVQAFWAKVVRTRPEPADEADEGRLARPETYDALLAAYDEHSAALVDALERADPAEEAWHWSADHTVGASYRRQAHEALIHRLDAEETAGRSPPLDPALAADGVLEALDVMYGGCPPWGTITPSDRVRRRSGSPTPATTCASRWRGSPAPTPTTASLRRARHRRASTATPAASRWPRSAARPPTSTPGSGTAAQGRVRRRPSTGDRGRAGRADGPILSQPLN